MFSTILLLLKIKKFLGAPIVKLFTSISGAVLVTSAKKKKFSIIRFIFKLTAWLIMPVLIITFITPKNKSTPTDSQNITIIQNNNNYDDYINAIKKGEAIYSSSAGNAPGAFPDTNNSYQGAIDQSYILTHDVSKLTDIDKERLREYIKICEESASKQNVPPWVIIAINILEKDALQLSDSGVYVGPAKFDECRTYGTVHPGTKKVVNYTNYGKDEVAYDGNVESSTYVGPFQLDSAYGAKDRYNFVESANVSINAQSSRYKAAKEYFEGITDNDDFLWAVAITMHNTGNGGFYARVPKKGTDTRQHFYNSIMQIQRNPKFTDVSERMFKDWGNKANLKDMFLLFDGLEGISYAKELVEDFNTGTTKSPIYNTSTQIKSTPGDNNGKYCGDGGGETVPKQGFKVYLYGDKRGCVIGATGNKQYGWEFDYEAGRYLFGGLTKGKYLYNTAKAALSEIDGANAKGAGLFSGSSFKRIVNDLRYYWKSKDTANNVTPESLFDEVGYKGSYPIFVQGTRLNDVSKTPWKFSGQSTTLGASGCSLFTLASLIHGVGYGQVPIPNQPNGVDGLNENGYICLQELAKAIPNGPVISDSVSALGYIVKTVPTTDEGLEELYGYLKQGIPFAVNVRYGDITGYDEVYNPHTVHFTNEGHFLLLVGAFELGDKRYVEVVQSTYSNAGKADNDQNALVFDFDELKEKKIIRSGSGYCVPAYTITGIQGSSQTPSYMKPDYSAPTRVQLTKGYSYIDNTTTQTDFSVDSLVTDIKDTGYIYLPKDLYIKVYDEYIDIFVTDSTRLRVSNFELSNMIMLSSTYSAGTFIGSVNDSTIYEHYEGDSLITQQGGK